MSKKCVNFINDETGVNTSVEKCAKRVRRRERVDYAAMMRGSSLIPVRGDSTPSPKSKTPDQTKKKVNKSNQSLNKSNQTMNKSCIYTQIEKSDNVIRPSQVFEFNFDPIQESKLKLTGKKQAKDLKKIIRLKSVASHANDKPKIVKKAPQKLLPRLTFGDHLRFKTPDKKRKCNIDGNENVVIKQPVVQLQRMTFNKNLYEKPQSTPNQKEKEQDADADADDNMADAGNDVLEGYRLSSYSNTLAELSQICEDFDEIADSNVTTTTQNQSNPWRAELIFDTRRNIFMDTNLSRSKSQNTLKDSINCHLDPSNKKQTSITSYFTDQPGNNRKTVHFNSEANSKSSSLNSSLGKSVNSSESSISDISQGNKSLEEVVPTGKKSKVNFGNAVTSSPSVTRRVTVLGDKNIYPNETIQNRRTSERKKNGRVGENKENHIRNENIVMPVHTKTNNDTFFGFDISNTENIDKRKSKKPIRTSISELNVILKPQKQNVSSAPNEITQEDTQITEAEPTNLFEDECLLELDGTPAHEIFDEPRFTDRVNQTYSHYGRKRKKKVIDNFIALTDDECEEPVREKKKRPTKKSKKEDEFEKWAQQFNSMCDEVEKEELVT